MAVTTQFTRARYLLLALFWALTLLAEYLFSVKLEYIFSYFYTVPTLRVTARESLVSCSPHLLQSWLCNCLAASNPQCSCFEVTHHGQQVNFLLAFMLGLVIECALVYACSGPWLLMIASCYVWAYLVKELGIVFIALCCIFPSIARSQLVPLLGQSSPYSQSHQWASLCQRSLRGYSLYTSKLSLDPLVHCGCCRFSTY